MNEVAYEFTREQLSDSQTSWIIPAKKTLLLVVRFFSKSQRVVNATYSFENKFSLHRTEVKVRGICELPSISSHPKNIYWNVKK